MPRLAAVLAIALAATTAAADGAAVGARGDAGGGPVGHAGGGVEVALDLTVGLLAELRLQLLLASATSPSVGLEAMFGGVAPYFGKAAGLGCRLEWRLAEGERDSLLLSPGVDLYVVFGEGARQQSGWFTDFFRGPQDNIGLVSLGPDVGWRHAFSPAFAMVLGARGAGIISLGGREANGNQTGGRLYAVGGLFAGIRF